jgi:hypothetical protein
MSKIEEYRNRAAECAALAKAASDPRFRDLFMLLERCWMQLAASYTSPQQFARNLK